MSITLVVPSLYISNGKRNLIPASFERKRLLSPRFGLDAEFSARILVVSEILASSTYRLNSV
jgi:hypothetical protein